MNDDSSSKIAENMDPDLATKPKRGTAARRPKRRPVIELRSGALDTLPEEIAKVFSQSDAPYYRRDRILVKAVRVMQKVADKSGIERQLGAMTLVRADPDAVRRDLAKCADVTRYDARQGKTVPADLDAASARAFIAAAPELTAIPVLRGIATVPILRDNGSLFFKDGYDPVTELMFDTSGAQFNKLRVPVNPTVAEVEEALRFMKHPLCDFGFVTPVDYSVALSALFSSVLRPVLPTCPLHGYSAPSHGAGKSILCEVNSLVCTGNRLTVVTCGHSADELQKRVDALALAGDPLVCIDNVSIPLGGDTLCALLTSETARIRPLGRSDMVTVPSSTFWLTTGVNLVVRGDMVRRSLIARIDPNTEHPEARNDFVIPNLIEWVKKNRIALLRAIFTILTAHARAGYPCGDQVLGGFTEWSRKVRGVLLWLGEADPVASQAGIAADDPVVSTRRAVFSAVYALMGSGEWTAFDLAEMVSDRSLGEVSCPPARQMLAEALRSACREGVSIASIGYWLRDQRDVIADGLKLTRRGDDSANRARYQLVKV